MHLLTETWVLSIFYSLIWDLFFCLILLFFCISVSQRVASDDSERSLTTAPIDNARTKTRITREAESSTDTSNGNGNGNNNIHTHLPEVNTNVTNSTSGTPKPTVMTGSGSPKPEASKNGQGHMFTSVGLLLGSLGLVALWEWVPSGGSELEWVCRYTVLLCKSDATVERLLWRKYIQHWGLWVYVMNHCQFRPLYVVEDDMSYTITTLCTDSRPVNFLKLFI